MCISSAAVACQVPFAIACEALAWWPLLWRPLFHLYGVSIGPSTLVPLLPEGTHARLEVSIGTAMLFIHGRALDEVTCHSAKLHVGWGFLGWKRCWVWLLLNRWKSGVFCAIELTNCIDLMMAMRCLLIAPYTVSTGGVNTVSSKLLFLLNPLRKRLIASLDARL